MSQSGISNDGAFPVTHWTLVQALQTGSADEAAEAMEMLCQCYWYPIYAFLRRSNYSRQDAEDLTQAFFAGLIADETLRHARRDSGKLRSFLLGTLKRHISDHHRHLGAQKRGGGCYQVSFDEMAAEERYAREPLDTHDPEWLYTKAWAHELLASVREKLRVAYEATDRRGLFDVLAPFISLDDDPPPHREVAKQIGSSEAATGLIIHRLRMKLRDLLHAEVAQTVMSPHEVPGELAWLKGILAER